jgi:2-polyprenyl-3-methyl-5-hydroxy-6-metoxy-1,4-benzoquinol methylase
MTSGPSPLCQGCGAPLTRTVVDLGLQPLANSYVPLDRADAPEPVYPLHVRVCDRCLLVQVDAVASPEHIFVDYAYFSSFSDSWLAHCKAYAEDMAARFGLGSGSRVVEVASNDGYLLQYFVAMGVPVMGIEPAANVAATAIAKGVPTEIAFFGAATAQAMVAKGWSVDLLAAKNVLAHVPDINDFVAGVRIMLKPEGVFTVEFPHLLNLIREVQFDTIYHEHFTYLSLLAVRTIAERQGLKLIDVEKQPTHGGSLRVFMARSESQHPVKPGVQAVCEEEIAAGLGRAEGYEGFDTRVRAVRDGLLGFLAMAKSRGESVVAYGAAAKGNTLLNYCGVTATDIPFVVDRNPAKQDRLLPGSHIPVRPVADLVAARPDHVLILPWNIKDEVMRQLPEVAANGGDFVTAVPEIQVVTGAV